MQERSKAAGYVKLAYKKGYQVTANGTIIGSRGLPIRGSLQNKHRIVGGYRTFNLKVGKQTKRVFVHQLQAYQKFGAAALAEGIVVRHRDNISLNNSYDNITIGTQQQNAMDRDPEKRQAQAQKAANARKRWTDEEVLELRARHQRGVQANLLAKEQKVCKSTMSMMLNNKTYRSVTSAH